MMSILKTLIKSYLPQLAVFQRIYLGLYYVGIWGMNYGVAGNNRQTGESYSLKLLKKKISKPDPVIFDVGANIGNYTLILKDTFGKRARIHAFEPVKLTYEKLSENVGSLPHVQTHPVGLSDQAGKLKIHFDPQKLSRASIVEMDLKHFNEEFSREEIISTETLDSFCKQKQIDHIDLLKIDVEGYEINVFRGAKSMLENKNIDYIQFEFGNTQIDAKVFFKDLWNVLNTNYVIHRILRSGLYPIYSYTESLEIFHFANFVAIRKDLYN